MPSAQVIDLGPDIYKQERNVGGFISDLSDAVKNKQEKQTIDDLISQYQSNREDANAWEDLQLGLEKSPISPTKRLQTQASLNEMRKGVIEKDKALNAKAKESLERQEKEEEKAKKLADEQEKRETEAVKKENIKKEVADILRVGGEKDEDVIKAKSDYMSPQSARFEATKNLNKDLADKKAVPLLGGTGAQKEITTKVITPILEAGKNAKELLLSAGDYRKAIENLKGGSSAYKHILNVIPGADRALENALNADEQTINSITKKSIISSGELKGLRLTDTKLRYIQGANPGPLKSYEANVAAYDIWLKTLQLLSKKAELTNQFISELAASGQKDYPADFNAQLEERFEKGGLYDDAQELALEAKKVPDNPNVDKNTFDSLPDPAKYDGKTIKDDKTGKKFVSNGKTWVPK